MIQYNLTSSNSTTDLTFTALVSDGSTDYDIAISSATSVSLQLVYDDTDAADDTWELFGSEDGTNFYPYPAATTLTSTITAAAVTSGWQTEMLKSRFLRVSFTQGSSTTGTYKLILTTKFD